MNIRIIRHPRTLILILTSYVCRGVMSCHFNKWIDDLRPSFSVVVCDTKWGQERTDLCWSMDWWVNVLHFGQNSRDFDSVPIHWCVGVSTFCKEQSLCADVDYCNNELALQPHHQEHLLCWKPSARHLKMDARTIITAQSSFSCPTSYHHLIELHSQLSEGSFGRWTNGQARFAILWFSTAIQSKYCCS